jgi:hypothetical protein
MKHVYDTNTPHRAKLPDRCQTSSFTQNNKLRRFAIKVKATTICQILEQRCNLRSGSIYAIFPNTLLLSLLWHQSILVSSRICINLAQFARLNAFCHSMKREHNSSFISKVRSDIILSIPVAFLFLF